MGDYLESIYQGFATVFRKPSEASNAVSRSASNESLHLREGNPTPYRRAGKSTSFLEFEKYVRQFNVEKASEIVATAFEELSEGPYPWLQELSAMGCTYVEMVELMDERSFSPWIRRSRLTTGHFNGAMDTEFHHTGCIHALSRPDQSLEANLSTADDLLRRIQCQREVEELCGIAGYRPFLLDSTDRHVENQASFSEKLSVVHIEDFDDPNRWLSAMENACLAVGRLQTSDMCCDKLLVPWISQGDPARSHINLHRISFETLHSFTISLRYIDSGDLKHAWRFARDIICINFNESEQQALDNMCKSNIQIQEHCIALAIQMISLGLLLYTQAYIGDLEPSFLVQPVSKVVCLGYRGISPTISLTQYRLTCLEPMVKGRIFAFTSSMTDMAEMRIPRQVTRSVPEQMDLFASPEDIATMFGKAQLLALSDGTSTERCIALIIGHGIMYPTYDTPDKFHWTIGFQIPYSPRLFKSGVKVTTGTLIVNHACPLDSSSTWIKCSTQIENLGPFKPYWQTTEVQLGIQTGQYLTATAVVTRSRILGSTLKDTMLRLRPSRIALNDLDDPHGLQFSL